MGKQDPSSAARSTPKPWMDEIDARLRARAGNPPSERRKKTIKDENAPVEEKQPTLPPVSVDTSVHSPSVDKSLSEADIDALVAKFRR